MRHRSAWTTSGHHDPVAWAAATVAPDSTSRRSCGLPFCSLWIDSERNRFCKTHETRWRMQGRPDVEGFISRCLLTGRDRIDFSGLPPLLKLELQYAVQCRVDADQDQLKRAKSGDFYLATSGANELAVDTVATC
jgi:hypothetical protein